MNTPIGGYFGLELGKGTPLHRDALGLNSARNGFEYILRARGYRSIHMPLYTCEVMFEAPRKLGISVSLYPVDERLEPRMLPDLREDEAFVYTNYFGLKQDCVEALAARYGNRLIVDDAQAFFAPRTDGIDTFYSPRKFFGVPDGGYLYTDVRLETDFPQADSLSRAAHLLLRLSSGPEAGYEAFRKAEATLDGAPIQRMSDLTSALLECCDCLQAAERRRRNYGILDRTLRASNKLDLTLGEKAVPMVYPYLTDDPALRAHLIKNRIYVARYWPLSGQASHGEFALEHSLSEGLVPLPIDQRYNAADMQRILELITT